MSYVLISPPQNTIQTEIRLPASKSESNRALIIQALTAQQSEQQSHLDNLSEARDTQTMIRLLQSSEEILDVIDAGTTMRFLTAYTSVVNQKDRILTGTARMQERPIQILVDALRELGYQIDYVKKEGFPPIRILAQEKLTLNTHPIKIKGNVSSQYISALLMIAPLLPQGLHLELIGEVYSRPYIQMTLELMQHFGIKYTWQDQTIRIEAQPYQARPYTIESDWSGASYWYSIIALSEGAKVYLPALRNQSLQGDRRGAEIMKNFGVQSQFDENGVHLSAQSQAIKEAIQLDFSDCPDLAQTVLALATARQIPIQCTGLESLRIKETDRIQALQNELKKFGGILSENSGSWELSFSSDKITNFPIEIETYEDHRMAMAFAPLATQFPLKILDPQVVVKSYPRFWEDLAKAGFKIEVNE